MCRLLEAKREPQPLELELQVVVSLLACAGDQTYILCKSYLLSHLSSHYLYTSNGSENLASHIIKIRSSRGARFSSVYPIIVVVLWYC